MAFGTETYTIGKRKWMVKTLHLHARDLEPFDCPINVIEKTYNPFIIDSFADYVEHYKRVRSVRLEHPIILSADGAVMDGRHRIIKAMLRGDKTIKAVQFEEDPPWDWWLE